MTTALTLLVAVPPDAAAAAGRTVASLLRQEHADWQLVLVGAQPDATQDPRVLHLDRPDDPTVAATLQVGLDAASGTHVVVLGAGDELEPGALEALLPLAAAGTIVYTDEQWPDPTGAGLARKPDYLPHHLTSYPYLGRLCAVPTALARELGGFRPGFEGAEEWDLALRVRERAAAVVHAPFVAVTRCEAPAADDATGDAGVRAVQDALDRSGRRGTAERTETPLGVRTWWEIDEPLLVSIVIPTAGGRREVRGQERLLVEQCLESLVTRTTWERWEVVLVTSEHTPDDVVPRCRELLGDRLVLAPVAGRFNFSTSVNEGARVARGDLVLLLNDDTEVVEPRWLERMVSVAQDPDVGVVGAKLLFEDGTLQHVGVSFDDTGYPIHVLGSEADDAGQFGTKTLDVDYTAVTGACLLTPAAVFERVGGFPEHLPLNFNDVDYCFKVRALGLSVVCTNAAVLHHYESSTRGHSVTADERAAIDRQWGLRRRLDPHVQYRSNF